MICKYGSHVRKTILVYSWKCLKGIKFYGLEGGRGWQEAANIAIAKRFGVCGSL